MYTVAAVLKMVKVKVNSLCTPLCGVQMETEVSGQLYV